MVAPINNSAKSNPGKRTTWTADDAKQQEAKKTQKQDLASQVSGLSKASDELARKGIDFETEYAPVGVKPKDHKLIENFLDALEKLFKNPQLKTIFANISKFFEKSVDNLFKAFEKHEGDALKRSSN